MNVYNEQTEVFFTEHNIYQYDEVGRKDYIMEDWEYPIMVKHAELVSKPGWDVLEIGFGMGISANLIQSHNPASHTIVELHPQILEKLREWAKDKPNVRIIEGDWFSKVDEIISKKYDGIFLDPWKDFNDLEFEKLVVSKCIKPNGVFSYFMPSGKDIFRLGWKLNKNYIGKVTRPTRVIDMFEFGVIDEETYNRLPKQIEMDSHVPYAVYTNDEGL